jgi:hypothetical protein
MGMRKDFILSQEEIHRRKGFGENLNISSKRSSTLETNSESFSQTFDEIGQVSFQCSSSAVFSHLINVI